MGFQSGLPCQLEHMFVLVFQIGYNLSVEQGPAKQGALRVEEHTP